MKRTILLLFFATLVTVPSIRAQASLASLHGTYTFQMIQLDDYSIESNMNGQQVGFCSGPNPAGYGCWNSYTFDTMAGSLVADGAGHISSGTYTITRDPNSYQCNPKNNPTKPCPVIVPSGHTYSTSTAYSVGATVDFTVGNVTRTFQAVRAGTGKPPNWGNNANAVNICSNNNGNLNTCYWTQIPESLTNGTNSGTGTLTGTYTIQANGSGVMTLTPTNCDGCGTVQLIFVVSPTSQVGQSITLSGLSKLGNSNNMTGSGVRIK
jgi:hypothetical protein